MERYFLCDRNASAWPDIGKMFEPAQRCNFCRKDFVGVSGPFRTCANVSLPSFFEVVPTKLVAVVINFRNGDEQLLSIAYAQAAKSSLVDCFFAITSEGGTGARNGRNPHC